MTQEAQLETASDVWTLGGGAPLPGYGSAQVARAGQTILDAACPLAYVPQVGGRLRANFDRRRGLLVEGLAVPSFGAVDVLDGQGLEFGDQGV